MTGGFEIGTDGPSAILVCVDGSDTSLRAGAWAAGMARRQHARLVVAYVAAPNPWASFTPGAAAMQAESLSAIADELRRAVEAAAAPLGVPVLFRSAAGQPYDEIVRIATEDRVDAVVVGASQRVDHRWVGSLAVRLVRAGKWPVTVVP